MEAIFIKNPYFECCKLAEKPNRLTLNRKNPNVNCTFVEWYK